MLCDDSCGASSSGDRAVRVSDVRLKNGTILQFEVRFGDDATSSKFPSPPQSRMLQVNLENSNSRVVVDESQPPRP
jgi:hypothetical protein